MKLRINGADIRYFDNGRNRPAMVFCHGNSSSARAFDVLTSILGRTVRTIAVDLYGHGESALPAGGRCTIRECAGLLQELVSALDLGSFTLVGHSFGGHVAMEAAPRLAGRGLKGLIAISAPPFGADTIGQAFRPDPSGGLLFTDRMSGEQAESLAGLLVNRGRLSSYQFNAICDDLMSTKAGVRSAIGACVLAEDYSDEVAIVEQLDVPTFFIQGNRDRFVNLDYYAKRSDAPDWRDRACFVDGCGHFPHIEGAYRVGDIIKRYVRTHLSAEVLEAIFG